MQVTFTAPDGPLRHGWPRLLTLHVDNPGPDCILLEAAWGSPLDGRVTWRERPLGAVVYDAAQDRYRHLTHLNTRGLVPLDRGLLPPESRREADLPLKSLTVGPRAVELTVAGWRVPSDELDARVYLAEDTRMRQVATYQPLPRVRAADPEARQLDLLGGREAIVRVEGCERVEVKVALTVEVAPDAGDPGEAALARAGGGALVQRCRRLQGAWVVRDAAGDVHLVRGARHLRLAAGVVEDAVWTRLEEELPFEPVLVLLRAPLPGRGEQAQQHVEPEALWELLAEAAAAGLRVGWGRHSAINAGLIVEPA